MVLALGLLSAAPAAAVVTTSSQIQTSPGITERVIWGQNQVAIYKVAGVNHIGSMHFEAHWRPTSADLDIYLLDASQTSLNEPQGFLGALKGREVIDYYVPSISPAGQQLSEVTGQPVGDTYYIVVTAYNGAARFWVDGYYQRIVAGTDTVDPLSAVAVPYRRPAREGATRSLSGAPYGSVFGYRPTSEGDVAVALEWPANGATKRITYDPVAAPRPANFQHYGFAGTALQPVFSSFGPENWAPPAHGDPPSWYGLLTTYAVAEATPARPGRVEHYVPVLYLAAADPLLGSDGPLKTGITTVGYRATLDFPQNLYLASAPSAVFRGMPAALRGTLARNGDWAPPRTPVRIQRRVKDGWKTVVTAKVRADGAWTAIIYPRTSATWRAMAAGDAQTGLAVELSVSKRIVVH
jgi:hypothetical protein